MKTKYFNSDFSGKVAVITGGSGVLCGEMARELASLGASVAVLGRTKSKINNVVNDIQERGGTAMGIALDITKIDELLAAEQHVLEILGPCDILINGVGGNHRDGTAQKETVTSEYLKSSLKGSFFDFKQEGLDAVMALNYSATVNMCRIFGERMSKMGRGNIINISSMASYIPMTKVMAYGSAKAAINNFTQWLSVHLAPTGVRVNAIAPGFFLTEQNRTLLMGDNNIPTDRCQKILTHTPMNRLGKASDLIGTLLYLLNDQAAGFVTGTVINVDGGFQAYSGV